MKIVYKETEPNFISPNEPHKQVILYEDEDRDIPYVLEVNSARYDEDEKAFIHWQFIFTTSQSKAIREAIKIFDSTPLPEKYKGD